MRRSYLIIFALFTCLLLVGGVQATTWSSANGCWTATTGAYTLVMKNATGLGTWTIPSGVTTVEYVALAGGGAGGSSYGSGGGAGGLRNGTLAVTPLSVVNFTVGLGGAIVTNDRGQNGGDTTFSTITSIGGGGGGSGDTANSKGANGGSAGGSYTANNETGTPGQGSAGGPGTGTNQGGGGGKGGAGGTAQDVSIRGGLGGAAYPIVITGETLVLAGGGGGGTRYTDTAAVGGGSGGVTVGGSGGTAEAGATAATPETGSGGGGGGGSGNTGGTGSSGLIIIKFLTASQAPEVSFTTNVTSGVNPLALYLNDTSTGSPTYWNTSWGDNGWTNQTVFPATNITHLYSTAGTYWINEYATNAYGTANGTPRLITVYGFANSQFSVFNTAGTAPFTTYLYDTSTNTTGGTNSYYWMLGDGNVSTAQNLYYTWNITGTYSVNHSFSNGLSTSWNNKSAYITVGTPTPPVVAPVASFYGGPELGAPPLQVFFTDVSSNTPTSWNWSFGDGTFGISQNPTKWYNSSGFFPVSLTATNSAGSNTTTKDNFIMVY